jgi:hypothetical protein
MIPIVHVFSSSFVQDVDVPGVGLTRFGRLSHVELITTQPNSLRNAMFFCFLEAER